MKSLLRSLSLIGLAVCASTAQAALSAQARLETYYLNPTPAELPQFVQALSREGYFDRAEQVPVAIGFLGAAFARHPEQIDATLRAVAGAPERHQRLLAAAVWQSGHPLGAELLRALAVDSPVRAEVLRLANTPAQLIIDTNVASNSSMNLQWGAFLATGDERHVLRILDAIGAGAPAFDLAAQASLAQNAAAHPRVLEICRAQLERRPAEVQSVLRAALKDAPAQPRS